MFESLFGLPGALKQSWKDGKVPAKMAPQPITEAAAHPEEREWDGPKAIAPPLSAADKAQWAALFARGDVLSDDAESLVRKFQQICTLNLAQKKNGEEYRLSIPVAWDWMENATRLLEKLEDWRQKTCEARIAEAKKNEDFCNAANFLISQKEKELSNERMRHHDEISSLKQEFDIALAGYKDTIANLEKNPHKELEAARLKFDGANLALKSEHAQALTDLEAAHKSQLAAKDVEIASAITASEEKSKEKISKLEQQYKDMEGLEMAAREEIKTLKTERIALHLEMKKLRDASLKPTDKTHTAAAESEITPIKKLKDSGKVKPTVLAQLPRKRGRPKKVR